MSADRTATIASIEELPLALRPAKNEPLRPASQPPPPAPFAHWEPGQRDAWHAELPPPSWEEAAATLGLSEDARRYVLDGTGDAALAAAGIERPHGPRIAVWRTRPWLDLLLGYGPNAISRLFGLGGGSWRVTQGALRGFVAAHEFEVVRIARAFPAALVDDLLSALLPIADVRVADLAARRLLGVGPEAKQGEASREWLLAHARHAAWALTATALTEEGGKEKAARLGLRELAERGRRSAVEEAARAFGVPPEALLVVRETSELPSFWNPDRIDPPVLTTGKRLPTEAVEAFLRLHTSRDPRAAAQLADVVPALEPLSLERFAMDVFGAALWRPKSRTTELWPELLGRYGGDAAVEALVDRLKKEWLEASTFCEVVRRIGTSRAIVELAQLAQRRRLHEALNPAQDAAEVALEGLAITRGTTTRALVGEAVARLAGGVTQPCAVSFGPRAFRVELDSQLSLVLLDEEGAPMQTLPRPRKSDDVEAVSLAKEQLGELRARVALVAPTALSLLEEDLVQGRRWSNAQLEAWLGDDELFRHVARHLVWALWSEAGEFLSAAFVENGRLRPTTDGAPKADRVGLLHPVELPDDALAQLRELVAARGLQPPFAQLQREVFRPSAEESQAKSLDRFAGARLRLRRPLLRGWTQGPVDADDAHLYWVERRFECGVTAELVHSGIDCGDAPPSSVKLKALRFRGAAGVLALSDVPARLLSEAARDAADYASESAGPGSK